MTKVRLLLLLLLMARPITTATVNEAGACLSKLPLHASTTNLTAAAAGAAAADGCPIWECDTGYYKTNTARSTCRICTTTLACPVGWYVKPCAPDADAECVRCPDVAGGRYTALSNNCSATECVDGFYYNRSASACVPCERGFYCQASSVQACGPNCTIDTIGAASMLECSSIDPAAGAGFSITYILSLPQTRTAINLTSNTCTQIDLQMAAWIKYGTFYGCHIDFTTDIMGTIVCQVSCAPCAAGPYMYWLIEQVHSAANVEAISKTAREACLLNRPDLSVGAPIVQTSSSIGLVDNNNKQQLALMALALANNKDKHGRVSVPLVYASQPWGTRKTMVLNLLGGVSVACVALLLTCMCFCTLACFVNGKQSTAKHVYAQLALQHKTKLKHFFSLKRQQQHHDHHHTNNNSDKA